MEEEWKLHSQIISMYVIEAKTQSTSNLVFSFLYIQFTEKQWMEMNCPFVTNTTLSNPYVIISTPINIFLVPK